MLCTGEHPNIVQVFAFGKLREESSFYFIDMELCDVTLDLYVNGHHISPDLVPWRELNEKSRLLYICTICEHIVSALLYIHEHKLVHRDISPQNGISFSCILCIAKCMLVMFSLSSKQWKLGDFGLATGATSQFLNTTRDGRGKPCYRAPEILREGQSRFNNKSDIWSLGCVLYVLATGKKPFASDFEVFRCMLTPDLLPFGRGVPNFEVLDVFFLSSYLAIAPKNRPSAREIQILNQISRSLILSGLSLPQDFRLESPMGIMLQWAVENSSLDQVISVLKNLGVQNTTNYTEGVMLQALVKDGYVNTASRLLQAGASGEMAVFHAAETGDLEAIELLLELGVNVHAINREGRNVLYLAATHGHANVVQLLLRAGSDPFATDLHGITPMQVACMKGTISLLDSLLSESCRTIQDWTVRRGDLSAVREHVQRWSELFSGAGEDWSAISLPSVRNQLQFNLLTILKHDNEISCIRLSPNGRYIALACDDQVCLYGTATGTVVTTLRHGSRDVLESKIQDITFIGNECLASAWGRTIHIWQIKSCEREKKLTGHQAKILCLDVSISEDKLISASTDGTIILWDLQSATAKSIFCYGVKRISLSSDGVLIAAVTYRNIVNILDNGGATIARLIGHTDKVIFISFLRTGASVLSGALDGTLKLWDLNLGKEPICKWTSVGHNVSGGNITISPDEKFVASGMFDCGIRFWSVSDGELQAALYGQRSG